MAAQKLAYAPRGNLTLTAFVPNGVPELALGAGAGATSSAPVDAGADAAVPPPSTPASRCGCRIVGSTSEGRCSLAVGALLLGAIATRRRSRARG